MSNFSLNRCELAGRLVADPELKQTPSGVMVTEIRIGVNRKYAPVGGDGKRQYTTDFFNVECWRGLAEMVCKYLKKGMAVYVAGELHVDSYKDNDNVVRYYTKLIAEDLRFIDSRSETQTNAAKAPAASTVDVGHGYMPPSYGGNTAQANSASGQAVPAPQFEVLESDEELPF